MRRSQELGEDPLESNPLETNPSETTPVCTPKKCREMFPLLGGRLKLTSQNVFETCLSVIACLPVRASQVAVDRKLARVAACALDTLQCLAAFAL